MRISFVCSAGGHLAQLLALRPFWERHERFWISFDRGDVRERLKDERVYFANGPTNRAIFPLMKNFPHALAVLKHEKPDVLITNGAGIALPYVVVARFLEIKTIFIEVPDRLNGFSLTGRWLAPWVDQVVLSNERQRAFYPKGVVVE